MHQTLTCCCLMQVAEAASQKSQEEQRGARQQHAIHFQGLSSQLTACQLELQGSREDAQRQSQLLASSQSELAKTRDQLQLALEYRKTCKTQQAELKRLRLRITELEAGNQPTALKEEHGSSQPAALAAEHSKLSSQHHSGSQKQPAIGPAERVTNEAIIAGSGSNNQATQSQGDIASDSELAELLQKAREAEVRAKQEAQQRHIERKNIATMVQKKDQEAKALRAQNKQLRQQLARHGILQRPCSSAEAASACHVSPYVSLV